MVRFSSDRTGLRGAWTPEEDKKLLDYIRRYGIWNWCEIPKYAGLSRCGKSCRVRWMNYLRPNIKRGNYTREEERVIINLRETLGNRWSAIAAELPGRTDKDIHNYWHTHLKKRLQQRPTAPMEDANSRADSPKGGEDDANSGVNSPKGGEADANSRTNSPEGENDAAGI